MACPKCNATLVVVGNKLICPSDNCSWQCLQNEYGTKNQPWHLQICADEDLWNDRCLQILPTIVAREYQQLHELFKQNKIYGVLFQLKDLFEVMIKFPTLAILAEHSDNEEKSVLEKEIIFRLLSNRLSLGHWESIATACLGFYDDSAIMSLLVGITKLYRKHNIVNWRNETIGHGALRLDDSEDFRNDITYKLRLIKEYFDMYESCYENILFEVEVGERIFLMRGVTSSCELSQGGRLYINCRGKRINISKYFKLYNKKVYFFDTYFRKDAKVKLLDYTTADIIKERDVYFTNLFKNVVKENRMEALKMSSSLDDDIYLQSEEMVLNFLENPNKVEIPLKLSEWVSTKINTDDKGIYLLQMERGMGKTTFARIMDPHSSIYKIKINACVRAYYINDSYSYRTKYFQNNLVDTLRYNDKHDDFIKGNIPSFNDSEATEAEALSSILMVFKKIYSLKFGHEKLILIIDGLDEIPLEEGTSIFDYIPSTSQLGSGIYILLTCRTNKENPQIINQKLSKLSFTDKMSISVDDPEYIKSIKCFLDKNSTLTNNDDKNQVLMLAQKRFLYIQMVLEIIRFKGLNVLNSNINIFESYLDILATLYSEKYYRQMIRLLWIIASAIIPVSIKKISYLLSRARGNFEILAYLADIGVLLRKERCEEKGTVFSVANYTIKSYILERFGYVQKQVLNEWLLEVKDMDITAIFDSNKSCLLFNSFYQLKNYESQQMLEFADCNIFNIGYLRENLNLDYLSLEQLDNVRSFLYLCEQVNEQVNTKELKEIKDFHARIEERIIEKRIYQVDLDVMCSIGGMYENSVKPNYQEAIKWYKKVADAGDVRGMRNLGHVYEQNGHRYENEGYTGSAKEQFKEAVKWFRKGVTVSDTDSMVYLGYMYECGLGVKLNYKLAMKWYKKAAAIGETFAMVKIGDLYANGNINIQDAHKEAIIWYEKAANAGDTSGWWSIGEMYEQGYSIKKDYEEAVKWYRKAADTGDEIAIDILEGRLK